LITKHGRLDRSRKAPAPGSGALLLAYYDPDGRLVYAGRAGAGITQVELWRRLQPLAVSEMPLAVPPRRDNRFGSPLVFGRVLGAARAGRRSEISHLDRRQPLAPGRLRRPARGQASGRGAPFGRLTRRIRASTNVNHRSTTCGSEARSAARAVSINRS
jgi:hypothetical protein